MVQIFVAEKGQHDPVVLDLVLEYLKWGTMWVKQEWGLGFSAEETIEEDRTSLGKFMPPRGRLLLVYIVEIVRGKKYVHDCFAWKNHHWQSGHQGKFTQYHPL